MSEARTIASRVKRVVTAVARRTIRRLDPAAEEYRARVDHHERALVDVTAALQDLQNRMPAEVHALQRRADILEEHLPELLGLWSSAAGVQRRVQRQLDEHRTSLERFSDSLADHSTALDDRGRSIIELWERVEFVRKELMFELRYLPTKGLPASDVAPPVSIVNSERMQRLVSPHGLQVNLGCGHIPIEDFVNVDMRDLPGVDVVAAVDDLPFEDGSVDLIHSAHVLEHFAEEDLARRLLPYWFGKLRPGGTFRAVVPDGLAMVEGYSSGEVPFEDLRNVLYGGQEYEGDFHFTMFRAESLTSLLAGAGFVDVEVEAQGRRNDVCLELQVAGRRPS